MNVRDRLVSIHGGHSGQFCNHAEGDLEDIVLEYIRKGFSWIGITEHMPPTNDRFLYPKEISEGMDSKKMRLRFEQYMKTCKALREKYRDDIRIFVGFETETYSGSVDFAKELIAEFSPDYVVGSVHHVNDIPIDMTPGQYEEAAISAGGIDALYHAYFDSQFDMLASLKPLVAGHFDLVRIFDSEYERRLRKPEIMEKIERNLALVEQQGAILDFNLRALVKGAVEPYVSKPILKRARDLGIRAVPGDDSHGVSTVGLNVEEGIRILEEFGFDTDWPEPK
jgi:histidinol-phosphatase (PHP family)